MFYFEGGNMYIHRGDSATFDLVFGDVKALEPNQISIKDICGNEEIPDNGTPIRFSVKCDVGRLKPVIQKDYVVWDGVVSITLESKDTNCLPFGAYTWDIRTSSLEKDSVKWDTPLDAFAFTVLAVVGNV